jgi:hypothetical protein
VRCQKALEAKGRPAEAKYEDAVDLKLAGAKAIAELFLR